MIVIDYAVIEDVQVDAEGNGEDEGQGGGKGGKGGKGGQGGVA